MPRVTWITRDALRVMLFSISEFSTRMTGDYRTGMSGKSNSFSATGGIGRLFHPTGCFVRGTSATVSSYAGTATNHGSTSRVVSAGLQYRLNSVGAVEK